MDNELVQKLQSVEGCIEVADACLVAIKSLTTQRSLIGNQASEFRIATIKLHNAATMLIQYSAVQFQLEKMAEIKWN